MLQNKHLYRYKTTALYWLTNPNLLSLIGGEHLLYVLEVKNLESFEVINLIPDGAIDIILIMSEGRQGINI